MKAFDLTKGSIGTKIILLALPLIITNLMQVSYNFVDMFFIGAYSPDGEGVVALGTAGNYNWLATSYIMFATIGTQVLIAQSFGKSDVGKEKQYALTGILFALGLALIYSLITFFFATPLINIFGLDNPLTVEYAISYLKILSIANFFLMINLLFTAIYQALGKTHVVFFVTAIGVIINIVLDPLFIFTLKMGVDGAAAASAIGAFISTAIYIALLFFTTDLIGGKVKPSMRALKDIFHIGAFVGSQNVLFTFSAIIVSVVILEFGDDALGAQRIGSQIESFTWMIGGGISAVIGSFTAQNFGAYKLGRVTKGYRFTMLLMSYYGLFISLLFFIWGDVLISLFTDNKQIISIGATYMKILSLSQVFMLYEAISGGVFNGIGKSKYVAIYGISGNLARIALVFILAKYLGIDGIWIAISVSSIYKGVGITINLLFYLRAKYSIKINDFFTNNFIE